MEKVLLYSFSIFIMTFLVGLIPQGKNWSERHVTFFTGFGAGVLLAVSLLYMIPEAFSMLGTNAGLTIVLGFIIIYVLEKFFMMHPCADSHCDLHKVSIAAYFGLTVHGLIDGMALGSSVLLPNLGSVVYIAMLIHKAPESFSLSAILRLGHFSLKKRVFLMFIFSAMLPLGAVLSFNLLHRFNEISLGSIIALSAGTFLHISMCDLLPQLHKKEENKWGDLLAFLCGIGIMVVLSRLYNI